MQSQVIQQQRIDRARKQVRRIKGFYTHLAIYILVNTVLTIVNTYHLDPGESFMDIENFASAIFWGVGLIIHGATVFMPKMVFGTAWEQRKIKEFMSKEP